MKADHPITIDGRRDDAPPGGPWEAIDPVARGRVQILPAGADSLTQSMAVMAELERLASLTPEWDWSKAAVIAREWKYLDPVRSYCELHGIPAQLAYQQPPHFWRLRETQMLLDWLKDSRYKLVRPDTLQTWLDGQGQGPWLELLREAVAAYAVEVSDAELPTEHFLEWLAEWGREARRRQTGLLLVTAHRAKGLEFDHVAVLDGGWSRRAGTQDPDAERRLYYVAMTRARQTLILARMSGRHELLDGLEDNHRRSDLQIANPALLQRRPRPLATPPDTLAHRHVQLTLADVDLGFAGRFGPENELHRAIAGLCIGDPLCLRASERGAELTTPAGVVLGRLARAYQPPPGLHCISARVAAIVRRSRHDTDPEHADRLRSDQWEVVVPTLTYAP
jgi:ATP-dependent DNA helicase RecQ